jgi:hypothetical protein
MASSAGTNGNPSQTASSVVGLSPAANAIAQAAPGMPAPANCVRVCAPSSDMWANPGQWSVNMTPTMEAISQPLYSYQAYPALGASVLTFFQTPATGAITAEDTNMQLAAQLPAPQKFLIQGIGIDYLSGEAPVLGPRADAAISQANDFFAILRRGAFNLTVGTKSYLDMAPLMSLPPRAHFDMAAATASSTTPAAALQVLMSAAWSEGDVFRPIPILLEAGQNFKCTVAFPAGAVAIPSADAAARIGVVLYGTLYRSPQ